jgi:hypothetical protein
MGTPLEEFPPSFVFAPGFMHADRRGLVAYPGFRVATGIIGSGLMRGYDPGLAREMLAEQILNPPEPPTEHHA